MIQLSETARAEIMKTRETHPAMPAEDIRALAAKYGVPVYRVKLLRTLHAQLNGLSSPGPPRRVPQHRERELLLLLLLQRELTDAAIAARFGMCKETLTKYRRRLLSRPRPSSTIDIDRLIEAMEGAAP